MGAVEPHTARIRVVVVEDHNLVREGFVAMLGTEDDLEVVGEASDGQAALEVVGDHRPDVVLLDLRLPKLSGLDVLRHLKKTMPEVRVVVLTVHDEQTYVAEAVLAGADGYLLKTVTHTELTDAIRRVTRGEAALHPAIARTVLTELTQIASREGGSELSTRELDVLVLLAQGLSNKDIASRLSLGVETVKTHISNILGKLGAVDRTQAVALALRRGLIE